jgi:PKD repeat protein
MIVISPASFNSNPVNGFSPLSVQFTDTSQGFNLDQFYNYVTLLAHFDGLNGANTFIDDSSYHTAMNVAAGVPVTSNAQQKFGPTSLYCPTSSSAPGSVYVANPANRFVLQDDFTIECWAFFTPGYWNIYPTIMRKDFGTGGGYWLLRIQPDGKYHFSGSGPSGGFDLVSTVDAVTFNYTWVNICVTRSGNTLSLYFNGVLDVVTSYSGFIGSTNAYTDGGQMRISQSSGNEYWTGYIDEVRITKGICRYTGNYAVATQPFPNDYGPYSHAGPVAWYYNFGDGGTSTQQNPQHTFYVPGVWNVTSKVTFSNAFQVTTPPTPITVIANPATAGFTWDPSSPVAESPIQFTDTSSSTLPGHPTSWLWDFGDTHTSTTQDPHHTYALTGTYGVSLTVSGPDFGTASIGPISIFVGRDRPFSFANQWAGMQFFDNQGAPLKDGIIATYQQNGFAKAPLYADYESSMSIPSVTRLDNHGRWLASNYSDWSRASLNQPQTTNYKMVATAADGTTVTQNLDNASTQQLYSGGKNVTVIQDDPYMNYFVISSTSTDPFHDQGRTYMWDVAATAPISTNGTPSNPASYDVVSKSVPTSKDEVSYMPGVGYKFHRDGAYLIETFTKWLPISAPNTGANMRGRIVQLTGLTGYASQTFNSIHTDSTVDSTSVTSDFESYTYSARKDDVINIFHYMQSNDGGQNIFLDMTVRITRYGNKFDQDHEPVTTSFITIPKSPGGLAPVAVQFQDTSTGNPSSWLWNFGDGNTSTDQNPLYTYTTGGVFTPTLVASNSLGSSGIFSNPPITITAPPPLVQWILTYMDDTGTTLPLSVLAADPVNITDVQALTAQLNGFMWTRNDNTTPAYFNNPPEPSSSDNAFYGGRNYFFQDDQYSYGRWLYLHIDPYTGGTLVTFPFTVNNTSSATVNTEDRTFHANAGQAIVCCTQGLSGTYTPDDTFIRLMDNTGTELTENDDSGDAPNSLASYLTWTAVYTGNYTIKIGGYANNYASGVAGYQVT